MNSFTRSSSLGEKQIALLEPDQVMTFWPGLRAKMMDRPSAWLDATPEETLIKVMKGQLQMWGLINEELLLDAVLFTTVEDTPQGRVLSITGAWGEGLEDYVEVLGETIPKVAEQFGVDMIEVTGRPAWVRKLKRLGFYLQRVTMMRPVGRVLH